MLDITNGAWVDDWLGYKDDEGLRGRVGTHPKKLIWLLGVKGLQNAFQAKANFLYRIEQFHV